MPRPARLVVVAGTGTEVGKTWWGCALLSALRTSGGRVAARKPAQSFDPADPASARDASLLAAATGERADDVCSPARAYEVAMAPPMAADVLGRPPIAIADLLHEVTWPDGVDVGLVETAGGLRSPIAHDGDNLALLEALSPDAVVLVADAGLGTINLVRLSMAPLAGHRVVVVLNRYDGEHELHVRNRAWLQDDGCTVVTTVEQLLPHVTGPRDW
jgi:dethiobiotin synthetase